MDATLRLDEAISAVCPIDGVYLTGPNKGGINFADSATQPQKVVAQKVLADFDWSDAAQLVWQAARDRNLATNGFVSSGPTSKLIRAVMLTLLDYVNQGRNPNSQVTAAQLQTAVIAKLASGAAD